VSLSDQQKQAWYRYKQLRLQMLYKIRWYYYPVVRGRIPSAINAKRTATVLLHSNIKSFFFKQIFYRRKYISTIFFSWFFCFGSNDITNSHNFPKPVFVHHEALQYFRNRWWQMIVTFITWLDEVSKTFFHLSESADANK